MIPFPKIKCLALACALVVLSSACASDGSSADESADPTAQSVDGSAETPDSAQDSTEASPDTNPGTISVQATTPATEPGATSSTADTDDSATVPDNAEFDAASLPADSTEMAAELTKAELAVRTPELSNQELDAWGRRQQALYRHLSFHPEWVADVKAAVDPSVSNAVALNWEARENLAKLLAGERLHDTLPAWRVVAPPPADELIGYYKQAEAKTGIPWEFVAAINLVETRMGRIQGVSTAGALGPMQFLPTTWEECCQGDPTRPEDAIIGAATYLTVRGGPENMAKALWGYNNSDFYVNAVTAYASVIMEDERAYYGYHAWEIYFLTSEGLIRIPVGYEEVEEVDAATWLEANPELLIEG